MAELRYVRRFDAPRELVFACLTEPQHLVHFWGPVGVSTPLATIAVDLRPGGRFDTVMVNDADGSCYPTRAVYVEVARPERLVWDEEHTGMRVTVTLHQLAGDRTEVRIRQTKAPEWARRPEARAGFATSLNKFSAYLQGLRAEGENT